MMDAASLNPAHLTEEHISFILAPRLNALGRLDESNPAVELLTTLDESRAEIIAPGRGFKMSGANCSPARF